ncbi:hypothetical protein ACFS07_34725 [Undibacterium arcticum]
MPTPEKIEKDGCHDAFECRQPQQDRFRHQDFFYDVLSVEQKNDFRSLLEERMEQKDERTHASRHGLSIGSS